MNGSDGSSTSGIKYNVTPEEMEKVVDDVLNSMAKAPGFGKPWVPHHYKTKSYAEKNTGNSRKIFKRKPPWQ